MRKGRGLEFDTRLHAGQSQRRGPWPGQAVTAQIKKSILLEQLSHEPHMGPTICDPNISFWPRVNHEFIKERFNDITSIPSAFFHPFS